MPKPPNVERALILSRDHRRKYGSRIAFQVLRPAYIGELENVTLLLPSGVIGTIQRGRQESLQAGVQYELEMEGFPTAEQAEKAGMNAAQALLLTAISLNFGIRLNYHSHEPPTVFDRTVSPGPHMFAEGFSSWPQNVVLDELFSAFDLNVRERRLLLSMELFASASLESNDRARFVMAVSAFEPLAEQIDLGPEVADFVKRTMAAFDADSTIPIGLRDSVLGRLLQLRKESVRQALHRLCERWFPGDLDARKAIDFAYGLRSQLLHDGRLNDLDILLSDEARKASIYLRRIYAMEYGISLRAPAI